MDQIQLYNAIVSEMEAVAKTEKSVFALAAGKSLESGNIERFIFDAADQIKDNEVIFISATSEKLCSLIKQYTQNGKSN